MRYKAGVCVAGLHPVVWEMLRVIDGECARLWGREITVTAGTDGRHSDKSRHYVGLAADIRIRDLDGNDGDLSPTDRDRAGQLVAVCRAPGLLPPGAVVVAESDHIHIQFDGIAG